MDAHSGNLHEVCVVLPTRRAGLYLKKAIGKSAGKPVIAPVIYSIEDLINEISPLRIIDSTEALMLLYSISKPKEDGKKELFEEFSRWAAVFLSDIQEIDKYLVDPAQLFGNLEGIKELESWSLNKEDLTPFQENYLEFWQSLHQLYIEFNALLDQEGLAYEGKAMRMVAVEPEKHFDALPYIKYYAVGFNAISKAEEKIFKTLHRSGKLQMLWDADIYYYSDPNHEAGKFQRKLIPGFLLEKTSPKWVGDHLSSSEKQIHITGSPSNTLQVKAASEWLEKTLQGAEDHTHTVLVLADESLLLPVLNSIPSSVRAVNVSMGYALKFGSFAGLIEALLNLHENAGRFARRNTKGEILYYHKDLESLLLQPMFRELSGDPESLRIIPEEMRAKNRIFVSIERMCESIDENDTILMRSITTGMSADNALTRLESLATDALQQFTEDTEGNYFIEKEFLIRFCELFRTMSSYHEKYKIFSSFRTIREFLKQSLSGLFVPFLGEPLNGIQVMGMLETRCLDFDNVAILSVNENVLPSGKSASTFIPYDLRKHFGLPTYQDKDAIFSYHFYRLLQRAGNVHCYYTTVKDVFGSGEKSRFLAQLIHELPARNMRAKVAEHLLAPSGSIPVPAPIIIRKEGEIMRNLLAYLERGVSPSSLNTFLSCPLRFCFRSVIGMKEEEEVEESMDARMLGNAIHRALERAYRPFEGGKQVHEKDVQEMRRQASRTLHEAFEEIIPKEEISHGRNFLAFKAGEKYLDDLFSLEEPELRSLAQAGKSLHILHVEKELSFVLNLNGIAVKVRGFCDRIDSIGGKIRIIDYKTGLVENRELKAESIAEVFSNKKDKALQLLLYALLFDKEFGPLTKELSSGIISFRKLSEGFLPLAMSDSTVIDADQLASFQSSLEGSLAKLLDPSILFSQTEDTKVCERCEFRSVCSR